jgi:hypothetical protein
MPDPTGFRFNARLRRYQAPNGRIVSRAQVARALTMAIDEERKAINRASRRLASGTLTVAEWQGLMVGSLRNMHTASAALAAGGWAQADRRDFLAAGRRLRDQYRYLRDFARQVESGEQPMDRSFLARADMYGRSARQSFDETNRRRDGEAGYTEERRRVNSTEPCVDCPRWAAMGWRPIGTLPLPTQKCQCRTNCRCTIERRRGDSVPPRPTGPVPKFGPSRARVVAADYDPDQQTLIPGDEVLAAEQLKEARATAAVILGRKRVSDADLASLAGATDGAKVRVRAVAGGAVQITVSGDGYESQRRLSKTRSGRAILQNDYFALVSRSDQGQGLGRAVFGRQVENASRLGVEQIETFAAGWGRNRGAGSTYNGYYTWPRFGYDGALSSEQRARLPEALKDAQRVSDLMRTESGRLWWKDNGDAISLGFDLAPGSLSRRTWEAYLAEKAGKGKSRGGPGGEPPLRRRRRGGGAWAILGAINPDRVQGGSSTASRPPRGDVPDFDAEDEAIVDAIWDALPSGPEAQALGLEDD